MPSRRYPLQNRSVALGSATQSFQRATGANEGPALLEQTHRAEKRSSSPILQGQASDVMCGLCVWRLEAATGMISVHREA